MRRTAPLLAAAMLSPAAWAGLIESPSTVRMTGFANGYAALDVSSDNFGTIGAGQLRGTLDGASFLTFCTDLGQSFSWNTNYSYTLVANGSTNGFSTLQADRLGKLYTVAGGNPTTIDQSAAFQLAVWEILYDTAVGDVTSGNFRLLSGGSTAQRDQANAWLAAVLDPGSASAFGAQRLYSSVAQDFVVFAPMPPQPGVPISEPSGLGLLALAIAGLAAGRFRA